MTYRIQRSAVPDGVVLTLSGELDAAHVAGLREFLAHEPHRAIVLDLKDVTFVDRAAVRFLMGAEAAGMRFVNCPEYVRSWIGAEQHQHEPEDGEPNS